MTTTPIKLAQQFADRLDSRDYDAILGLIANDCRYEVQNRLILGSEAIIAAYRNNTEWAFEVFDQIEFESNVISESESSARVTFTDHLHCGPLVHDHLCQQIVHVDEHGRIDRIVHVDLTGEAAALLAFFEKCGINPPKRD